MTDMNNVSKPPAPKETTNKTNTNSIPSFKASMQNNKQKHWMLWAIQLIQKFSASLTDETRQSLIDSLKEQQQVESKNNASSEAVKRLKVVLMQDRANVNPLMLDNLRTDMLAVIGKYVEIEDDALELSLDQSKSRIALIANIAMFKEGEIAAFDTEDTTENAAEKLNEENTAEDNNLLNESLDDLIEQELKDSAEDSESATVAS